MNKFNAWIIFDFNSARSNYVLTAPSIWRLTVALKIELWTFWQDSGGIWNRRRGSEFASEIVIVNSPQIIQAFY